MLWGNTLVLAKNLRVVSKAELNGPAVLHGHGPSDSRDCKHSKTIFFAAAVQAPKNPAWALYNKIPIIHQFTQVSTAHSMPLELIAIPYVTAPFHFLFRSAAGLHNCSAQWWGRLELQGLNTAKLCVWQPVPATVQGHPMSSNKCCLSRNTGRVRT